MTGVVSRNLIRLVRGDKSLIADRDNLQPFIYDSDIDISRLLDIVTSDAHDGIADDTKISLRAMFSALGLVKEATSVVATPSANSDDSVEKVELHLLMTQSCNIDCVYCYNGADTYIKRGRSRFTAPDAMSLICKIREIHPDNIPITLHFFGGEPLINWKEIVKIVDGVRYYVNNVKFYITTNLTMLPPEIENLFAKDEIVFDVTVDGPEEIHNTSRIISRSTGTSRGTYCVVANNIERLARRGIYVAAKMVLSKFNQHHIEQTIRLHYALGASSSAVTLLRSSDSDGREVDYLPSADTVRASMETLAQMYCDGSLTFDPAAKIDGMIVRGMRLQQYCGAGIEHSGVFDADGNAYNCAWFVGNPDYLVGRTNADTVQYDLQVDARFRAATNIEHNGGCAECNYRYMCGGPCPATRVRRLDNAGMIAFQKERAIKCSVTKPIVNALLWKYGLSGEVHS